MASLALLSAPSCLSVPRRDSPRVQEYRCSTSLLGPLLFEQERVESREIDAETSSPSRHIRRDTRIGPFGCLATLRESSGRRDLTLISIPFLGVRLFEVTIRSGKSRARLGLVPWLPVLSWDRTSLSHRGSIAPGGLLLDARTGPDRATFSLTPLLRYDRHGRTARLRVFFIDLFSAEPVE